MARAIRNTIRANRFARIIRNWNPYFIAHQADSHESLEFPIRVNHATKLTVHLLLFSVAMIGDRQMGSDANGVGRTWPDLNRILAGFYFLGPAKAWPATLKTHVFKGSRPNFNQIPWSLVKIWLKCLSDPIYPVLTLSGELSVNGCYFAQAMVC